MKPPFPDASPIGFDDGSDRWKPPPVSGERLRRFAIGLFLVSLASLFAATLLAYIYIRVFGPAAVSEGRATLPPALWVSTGVLLLCGVFVTLVQRAARAARMGQLRILVPLTWL